MRLAAKLLYLYVGEKLQSSISQGIRITTVERGKQDRREHSNNFSNNFLESARKNKKFKCFSKTLFVRVLSPIHTSRNYAGNLLSTRWQPMVAGDCHHIAPRRQWSPVRCQYIAIIVNGCQRLATFSNCLKKLPSVAVVTLLVTFAHSYIIYCSARKPHFIHR